MKLQHSVPGIAAALRLCTTALLPLLTEKLLCFTGIVAGCAEEGGCSWIGITAGITAGTTVGGAKEVAVGRWVAARWAWNGAGVGVEVVGAEVVRGDNDLLLVRLIVKVLDVVLQRSVGGELRL